jgi:hypothetical protein
LGTSDTETEGENAAAPVEAEESTPEEESPDSTGESEEHIYVPLEEAVAEPPTPSFRRVPNQRGVPEGEVSFTAMVDQNPDSCPMSHQPS